MYDQPSDTEQLETESILPHALPAGRDGRVESICSLDTGTIDTVAGYGILYLSLKYDKNPTGDFKFEGRVREVVKCKVGREMMGFIQRYGLPRFVYPHH